MPRRINRWRKPSGVRSRSNAALLRGIRSEFLTAVDSVAFGFMRVTSPHRQILSSNKLASIKGNDAQGAVFFHSHKIQRCLMLCSHRTPKPGCGVSQLKFLATRLTIVRSEHFASQRVRYGPARRSGSPLVRSEHFASQRVRYVPQGDPAHHWSGRSALPVSGFATSHKAIRLTIGPVGALCQSAGSALASTS